MKMMTKTELEKREALIEEAKILYRLEQDYYALTAKYRDLVDDHDADTAFTVILTGIHKAQRTVNSVLGASVVREAQYGHISA